MNTTDQQTRFLTATELAARYSVSTRTVWRWRDSGALPQPCRLGNGELPRWPLSEIVAWEAERAAERKAGDA